MLQRGLPGLTGQSLKQGGRVVGHHTEAFVGIDTSKLRNAVAIADGGRGGEVRYLGEFPATEAAIRKLVTKLAAKAQTQNRPDVCGRSSTTFSAGAVPLACPLTQDRSRFKALLADTKGAKSRHRVVYSITLSARPSSAGVTLRPSALADLRLMINSTSLTCCTGRSTVFSPLRIW